MFQRAIRKVGAAATVGVVALTSVVTTSSSASRVTPPPIAKLGTAPAGYSLGDPQVLRTRDGVMLAAWNEYLHSPNHIRLARKVGTNPWARVSIPQGALIEISPPYLIEDTVNDRVIMAANAQTGQPGGLGTHVWTSATNGRTWTGPTMVWDNLGSGNLTSDGSGGFYAVSDVTGVSVVHVPSGLTEQHWPDDDIVLSDRIASRGALDLATIGQHDKLLFGFADGLNRAWIHVTSAQGNDHDVRVMTGLYADGHLKLAADRVRGVAAAIRLVHTNTGNVSRLFAVTFHLVNGSLVLDNPRPISNLDEDVLDFDVTTIKTAAGSSTGTFRIVWLNDSGTVRIRTLWSAKSLEWGATRNIVTFPARGYTNPYVPTIDGTWIAMHAYTSDFHEAEIAISLS
jgi:hypothetical protein